MGMLDLSSIYENEFDHLLWVRIHSLSDKVAKKLSTLILVVYTAIESFTLTAHLFLIP